MNKLEDRLIVLKLRNWLGWFQCTSDKFGLWKLAENNSESFRCDSDRFRHSIDLKKQIQLWFR